MIYNDNMKKIRIEKNLLQKDIASKLNISVYTYSHYETMDNMIPIGHLIEFCEYFDISLDFIFGFTSVRNYSNSNSIELAKVGQRLKEFRKLEHITQEKLASILNTNQSVIANYERGRNIIATPFLYDICKKYKVSADYLLGKIDEPIYLK